METTDMITEKTKKRNCITSCCIFMGCSSDFETKIIMMNNNIIYFFLQHIYTLKQKYGVNKDYTRFQKV